MSLGEAIDGARMVRYDRVTKYVLCWFGDYAIRVFDESGREVSILLINEFQWPDNAIGEVCDVMHEHIRTHNYPGTSTEPSGFVHTLLCKRQMEIYSQALTILEVAYPSYCSECGGYGYTVDALDPCPECEGADEPTCGLCATPLVDDDRVCGCPVGVGRPEQPECLCYWLIEEARDV